MPSILPLPPAVVGEFVGRSHADLARLGAAGRISHADSWGVRLGQRRLGNGAGGGGPLGRRDIVEFLLSKGARLDIFAAAFLGRMSLVKAFLHDNPAALHQGGPHGISLLDHAKKGGDPETVAFIARRLNPARRGPRPGTRRRG